MNAWRNKLPQALTLVLTSAWLIHPSFAAGAQEPAAVSVNLNIREQPLGDALTEFAKQSGLQIMLFAEVSAGLTAPRVVGAYLPEDALKLLLKSTDLSYEYVNARTVAIRSQKSRPAAGTSVPGEDVPDGNPRLAQMAADPSQTMRKVETTSEEQGNKKSAAASGGDSEMLVQSSRVAVFGPGNVDLKRTINDAQPYYIFDSKTIERSGATGVEDFIRKRIPMDANFFPQSLNTISPVGNISTINLRGLGSGGTAGSTQTLILINGRRAGGVRLQDFEFQPDLNGIPLAAIERIEVLPSTASGIYGGNAVGGVVNVVLRREYAGAEIKASYENTTHSDAPIRNIDMTAGLSMEGGRTNLLLSASYSDSMPLYVQDRDFTQRGLEKVLANNPAILFYPPLGATPNIKSQSGAPLFGPGTPNFTSVPLGYVGGGGLAPLQINAGRYNLSRPATANTGGGGLVPIGVETRINSVYATVRREFTPSLDMAIELNHSRNRTHATSDNFNTNISLPASAPNNPFGQAILVTVPLNSHSKPMDNDIITQRLVGSFTLKLAHEWKLQGDYTYNLSQLNYSFGLFNFAYTAGINSGALNILRDTVAYPFDMSNYLSSIRSTDFDSTLKTAALRGSGTLWALPGGPQTLTIGIESTRESQPGGSIINTYDFPPPAPSTTSYAARSQGSESLYMETLLPLVGRNNARPMLQEMDLQLAGRAERYENGTATYESVNPTVGLRYKPVKDLLLRMTYSRGFVSPSYSQLTPSTSAPFPTTVIDPRRGNASTPGVPQLSGGNPGLEPENSVSWNAGMVLEPHWIPGLRFAVDYFRIQKSDNIATLSAQVIVNNESLFPGRVTRGAVPVGDPFGIGPITRVDVRYLNLTRLLTEGYDVSFDYHLDTRLQGTFSFYGIASFATHFKQQLTLAAPYVEQVGKSWKGSPLKFRGNAGVNWESGAWTAGWSARYHDAYLQYNDFGYTGYILAQGSSQVPSQIYNDVFAGYRFAEGNGQSAWHRRIFEGLQVQAGIKNVLDARPPFDPFSGGVYYVSPYGDLRLRSFYVSVKSAF